MIKKTLLALFIFLPLGCLPGNSWAAEPVHTQANVPVEITFLAQRPHADPFNEVTLDVLETMVDAWIKGKKGGN